MGNLGHFAAIAGAGPLVGPVIAAQFGYLPGALWIPIGSVLLVPYMIWLSCSLQFAMMVNRLRYCPRRNQ